MAENVYSSKADVAYAELRERILSGRLEAGAKLMQYVLADELAISSRRCVRRCRTATAGSGSSYRPAQSPAPRTSRSTGA